MSQHSEIRMGWLGVTALLSLALVVTAAGCGSSDTSGVSSTSSGTGATGGVSPGGAGGVGGVGGAGGDECTEEVCDGLDNDCDSEVDEGCECTDGETQSCYSGDPNLLGIGDCVEGTQTCDLAGDWGPCVDEVLPVAEACDGGDNDCDGAVDEDFGSVTCGLGICQVTVDECVEGVPTPCLPGPPNPTETCDGTDDNCDGQVDEGCTCVNGTSQPCYTGSLQTQNIGECQDGIQTCVNGLPGNCVGDQTPTTETCDGLDNDCDTQVDENDPGGGSSCITGLSGVCSPGIEHCVSGQLDCEQNVQPSSETCNGLDDNCDGQIDEGNPGGGAACDTGLLGICKPGLFECQNGSLTCVQTTQPGTESCNGLDDDCDGSVDENNPGGGGVCSTGNPGICDAGTQQCQNGSLQCVQDNTSGPETCNGLDDDCDGATDEGNPGGGSACSTGNSGICDAGIEQCQNGGLSCVQTNTATTETCNGLDDDCDGSTDENNPGGGGACSTGLAGICSAGTQQCQNGGLQCVATNTATTETCNGLDDDCDGATDENNPGGGGACSTGLPGICSAGTDQCQNGSLQCIQTNTATSETCNGLDDDCDGSTDENNPGGGGACSTSLPGICAAGTDQCQNGSLSCVQTNTATTETCNGLDDDCDGSTDENNPGGGGACVTGLPGICSPGIDQCQNGSLQCIQTNTATGEVCNGLDDNCDGSTDEGNPGGGANCLVPGQQGECENGTVNCVTGALQCEQTIFPINEVCTNGLDDNCDGSIDEGCGGCNPGNIVTTYIGGNAQSGNMFDITALSNINVLSFAGNFNPASYTVEVYYKVGTHVGFEGTSSAWTLIGSTPVTSVAASVPTAIPLPINVSIPAGQTYAFYVTVTSGSLIYTNGTTLGAVYVQDANLQVLEGVGLGYPFGGTFSPRVWNGTVYYEECP